MRLPDYDYAQAGAYFITICTRERKCVLGSVDGKNVCLSSEGEIVRETWAELPQHAAPLQTAGHYKGPRANSLGTIIRSFKSAVTQRTNQLHNSPGMPFWQRSFYDHVIRDEMDLFQHRRYIQENPIKWILDDLYAVS